jgi:nucleoside-diphosphate-sugar epimerase
MEHVLVTGATGFIGLEVVRLLVERGLRPRALVRRPLRGALLASSRVEIMQGDLESTESLQRAVQGIDTVFHLGARAAFEDYELLRPTIVEGSVALMRAAAEVGVKTFVYSSSLLVYASQAQLIDDKTPAIPTLGYGRAKLESEEALTRLAEVAGMSLAAIRLPHVYGARDLLFEQVRRGRAIYPGSGENAYAHLHADDAARVLLGVADAGWSGTRAVADDQPATWNEFFAAIRTFYPRLRLLRIPQALALVGTSVAEILRPSRHRPFLYTPDAVRGANATLTVKPGLLWDEIDQKPRYPTIHQGIPAVLDECVAFRWVHPLFDADGI